MAKRIRQPLYVYDEPITYNEFYGGINNDPSNANIQDYELRDAINMHYNNRTLSKRLGAKLYKYIAFNETEPDKTRGIVQLQHTLTTKNDVYYIVARDGLLYYSSLNVSDDTLVMIELPIEIDKKLFDGTLPKYDSKNLVVGLINYEQSVVPNPLLDQEGYIKVFESDKDIDYRFTDLDNDDEVGILIPSSYQLILQNYKPMDAIVYNDEVYIASGTRFLKLYEAVDANGVIFLTAEIISPKEINGWEYSNIGFNYLSPFPEYHVFDTSLLGQAAIHNILCTQHYVFLEEDVITFDTIMDFRVGEDKSNYYFRWEYSITKFIDEDETGNPTFEDPTDWVIHTEWSIGIDILHLNPAVPLNGYTLKDKDIFQLRVTFTDKLQDILDSEDIVIGQEPDPIIAQFGSTYTSFTVHTGTSEEYMYVPSQKFLEIHTCNHILSDGNKIILYGTQYNSANWYKCVIDNFNYFSDTGQLDFQTNKNEKIIAAIHLDGNIIVFADNEHLGGSIHKVTGNGDDYSGDKYYSAYKRKLIHSSISCDHPNSVQYVENYILFKYRNTIWKMESRDLDSEKVKLETVNNAINHSNPNLSFPTIKYELGYERKLYSFVTEEYYGLVFPEQGLQWKMYYKNSVRAPGAYKNSFPWLRDLSPVLNTQGIITINGYITYLTPDNKLIQFNDTNYKDLNNNFMHRIIFKSYDLTYPGVTKFLNSILLNYSRGNTDVLKLNIFAYNEDGYRIYGVNKTAFIDKYTKEMVYANADNYYDEDAKQWDKPSLILNITTLAGSKLGIPYFSTKLFTVEKRFPFLNITVIIESESAEAFALSSLTYHYVTSNIPATTLPKLYSEIIREED